MHSRQVRKYERKAHYYGIGNDSSAGKVRVADGFDNLNALAQALRRHPVAGQYLFHVLVSEDVPLQDPIMRLWGWFTRFDPQTDLHPAERRIRGNRLVFDFPILVDARWKKGYPRPVAFSNFPSNHYGP